MNRKDRLFSCDSHAQIRRDAFTSRMPEEKFGDRIPRVVVIDDFAKTGHDSPVERWVIGGKVMDKRSPANCPAFVERFPRRMKGPQRWDEVPKAAYDPSERLKVIAQDGIDGEVLFPNGPVQDGGFFQSDAEFERACVRAYNDAMTEWHETSESYVPLGLIPILGEVEDTVAEVRRLADAGYRGILMTAEPSSVALGQDHRSSVDVSNPALGNPEAFLRSALGSTVGSVSRTHRIVVSTGTGTAVSRSRFPLGRNTTKDSTAP